jgi:peptidoglycan/LPS O-acetylase OafA/YrhL
VRLGLASCWAGFYLYCGFSVNNDLRVSSLDSLRGVACILLVVFHIIGSNSSVGLGLPVGSGWSDFNMLLENLRMPLFAFLSGVVFSFRGLNKGGEAALIFGKIKRLYLPLVFVGMPFLFVQANSGYSNAQVASPGLGYYLSILYLERFHYWFIHAIFLIFLFLAALSFIFAVNREVLLYSLFASVLVSFFVSPGIPFFSFSGFVYLLPYFLLGSVLRLYGFKLPVWFRLLLLCFLVVAVVGKYFIQENSGGISKISFYGYLVGFLGCAALYYSGLRSSVLSYVGRYSYTIFLFHVFFLAATRVVLDCFGIADVTTHVLIALFITILACIIVHKLCERNFILSWCFLGQRPIVAKS